MAGVQRFHVPHTTVRLAAAAGLAVSCATGTTFGQAVWTGAAGDGLWSTAGNWNPMQLPLTTDTVSIPAMSPGCVANIGVSIAGLSAQGGLTVRNSFTVSGASSVVNFFMEPGANIINSSGAPFVMTGSSVVTGTLSSGAFSHSGTMTASTLTLMASTLNNTGTVTVQTNLAAGGGTLANSGTLNFFNEGDASGNPTVQGITNSMTLNKTGMGTSTISCRFQQLGGTVNVQGGTLVFATGNTQWIAGSASAAGGATLRFDAGGHVFAGLESIGGMGMIEFAAGGTVGVPGIQVTHDLEVASSSTATISSGVVRIDAELRNNGNMALGQNAVFTGVGVLRNMPMRGMLVTGQTSLSSTTLINEGALLEVGGNLTLSNGATVQNAAGSLTRIRGQRNINNGGGGTNQLTNHGRLEKTEPGDGIIAPRFRQACGVLDVKEGAVRLTGGGDFVDDTTFNTAAAGAQIQLAGGLFTFTDAVHVFNGDGVVRFGEPGSTPLFDVAASGGLDLAVDSAGPGHVWITLCNLGGQGLIRQLGTCYCGGGTLGLFDGAAWRLNFLNNGQMFLASPPGENQSGATIRGGAFTNDGVVLQRTFSNIRDGAEVINNNRWIFEEQFTDTLLITAPAVFRNFGRFEKTFGGTVSVSGAFDNQGEVVVLGGTLIFGSIAQMSGGTLNGGGWLAEPGSTLDLGPACTRLTGDAYIETGSDSCPDMRPCSVIDEGAALVCNSDFVSTASSCSLLEGGSLTVEDDATFTCGGDVNNGGAGQSVLAYVQETVVIGLGPPPPGLPRIVTPNFNNRAQVRPGGNSAAGPFNLTGNLNCFEESVLQIELGGLVPESDHDRISVTGNVIVDGTLEVTLLPGYAPEGGEVWTIVTATGTVSGGFGEIVAPVPPEGFVWRARVLPGAVALRLACSADYDNDGTLGVPDIFTFLTAWFAQEPEAYAFGGTPGVPAIFAFLTAWFAGCGGA